MKPLEEQIAIAKKARALIEDPNNWTQGAYATDKDGVALDQPLDDEAVCFCMIGAIRRAEGNPREEVTRQNIPLLWGVLEDMVGEYQYPHEYNDTHAHDEVLAFLDKAIKRLEEYQERDALAEQARP